MNIYKLCLKPMQEFNPDDYKEYVMGLKDKPKTKPVPGITARWAKNRKSILLATRRKPKFIREAEIDMFIVALGVGRERIIDYCERKQITVVREVGK